MRLLRLLLIPAVLTALAPPLNALPFGVNKVRYHAGQKWRVLQTRHFDIHYSPPHETIAQSTARYAEDAFLHICQSFDYVPQKRIPLFLYGNGLEFQETNIVPSFLPEGVGGFTEAYKNRVVVPFTGSQHELEKVVTHELVHAFQYNLIYGEGWRSFSLFKSIFVPTWVMEGSAEWIAENWESQGEMVLRDSVLHDRLLPLDMLSTFDHFEQVYMAYKESQSILEYVAQVYGRDQVPLLVKKMTSSQKPDSTVKEVLGVDQKELYSNWAFYFRSRVWSRVQGRPQPDRYGEKAIPGVSRAAVSPDGSRVAYLRDRELGLYDPSGRKKRGLLHRDFQAQGSGIAWSPKGDRIAYVFRRSGSWRLGILDVATGKTREHGFEALSILYSPEWSPDGRSLVFSAYDRIHPDLFRFDLESEVLKPLTRTEDTETWPRFSPDGRELYFVREKGGDTRILRMPLDPEGEPTGAPVPLGDGLGEITSLHVQADSLIFTSDRGDRIFNLYRSSCDGDRLVRLTNTYVDVISSGASGDGKACYGILYEDSETALYRFFESSLEDLPAPPANLVYLSRDFPDAGRMLARDRKHLPKEPGSPAPDAPQEAAEPAIAGVEPAVTPVTTAPERVTGVRVSEASNIIQLRWNLPPTPGAAEIEHFRVYRATGSDGEFQYHGSTLTGNRDHYVDYTVQSGISYRYYVTAANPAGESPPSETVDAIPDFLHAKKDYRFRFSPDLFLFLAGYDSSFGFAGGGMAVLSDYLGNHRLAVLGDAIPNYRSGFQAGYMYSGWRTDVSLSCYSFQDFYRLYDINTGNVVDEFRDDERGAELMFTYPLSVSTRFEYGLGTQRFLGTPSYLRFSEGISNHFNETREQEEIANYYRLALVRDKRGARRFMPTSGYAWNLTYLQAPPVLDSNDAFRNVMSEFQLYRTFGFLGGLTWANRWVGMRSMGRNTQVFFLGSDQVFQSFFTTFRGFGSQTYYGSNLGLWNMELRYPVAVDLNLPLRPLSFILVKDVELAFFTDTGIVADRAQDMTQRRLLNSVGGGLRLYNFVFQRALVQLRFDVAWRTDRSESAVFHFNLAPIF